MIFRRLHLPGVFRIDPEEIRDERGSFARTWCDESAREHGITFKPVQAGIASNRRKGTLRGMHYQRPPAAEVKLFRCFRGAIYDVLLDLRTDSPTQGQWIAEELTAENGRWLYVPEGIAHGYQTLTDNTDVYYQMSQSYHAELADGVRWDDPKYHIHWPEAVRTISARDLAFPDHCS